MATMDRAQVVNVRLMRYTLAHEWRAPAQTTDYADLLRLVADHVEAEDGVLLDLSIHWMSDGDELVLRAYIEDENDCGKEAENGVG